MLFSDFRYILQLSKGRLFAYRVDIKNLSISEALEQEFSDWEELPEKLAEVKKVFDGQEFFLLIPEQEAKLYLFKLPLDTQNLVSAIEEQLGLQAEESLSYLTYDLKKMGVDDEEGIAYFQAIVARREYLSNIEAVLNKSNTTVVTIESPSFALARLTAKVKVPHLVYFRDTTQRLLCACFEGEVFVSSVLDVRKKLENATDEMVSEVKGRYGFEIKSLLVHPEQLEETEDVAGLHVKGERMLHPALGLSLKQDIKGADFDVLSLRFPEASVAEEGFWSRFSSWGKWLLIIAVVFIILAGTFLTAKNLSGREELRQFWPFKKPTPTITLTPVPTFTSTPTPTFIPTPTPQPKSELKIQVLNGSGVRGAAASAQEFLQADGWVVAAVGNAARYDYANTQIQIKKSKEDYTGLLKEKLAEKYQVADVVGELPEEESVDAIVVIGKS